MWIKYLTFPSCSTMAVLCIPVASSFGWIQWLFFGRAVWLQRSLMRMGNPFCSHVLFFMFLFSYHVEICWRLSVAELWVAASPSPLFTCAVGSKWSSTVTGMRGNFTKHLLHFIERYLRLALANKIIEIKFLSNESCQLPEPSCSSQAPLISLNFYHQSSFKFDIAIQEKTNHENLHVHLLHTHGKMVMKKGIYFHVLYIQSNFTSPTFRYSNSTICYN